MNERIETGILRFLAIFQRYRKVEVDKEWKGLVIMLILVLLQCQCEKKKRKNYSSNNWFFYLLDNLERRMIF